jgi:hypothetical protein
MWLAALTMKTAPMNPRLFRENGRWTCWGGIFVGYGTTVIEAYEKWRSVWNESAPNDMKIMIRYSRLF